MIQEIRHLIWESLKNVYQNKYRYLLTSVILQIFLMTVGRFSLAVVFDLALDTAGYTSLTKDNLLAILSQTSPFLLLILYVVLLAAFIFLELSCLIFMVTRTYRHYEFRDFIYSGWRKILWLSGPQVLIFLIYLLTMIPFENLGLSSPLLSNIRIPEFITGELGKMPFGNVLYAVFLAFIFFLNVRLIYFLPLSVVNDATPWQNVQQSWVLTKKRFLTLILSVAAIMVFLTLLGIGVTFVLSLVFGFAEGVTDSLIIQTIFYSLVRGILYLIQFFEKLILMELLVRHLLSEHERHPSRNVVTLTDSQARPFRYPKWSKVILWATVIIGLVYNGVRMYLLQTNTDIALIAHRGDVSEGVENSIEALEAAHQKGADFVEMDVVMTVDKQFLVIHDNDLNRLAEKNWQVSERTLAELEGLQIAQDSFTSQIVSLETYIQKAQALQQPLLIELKPYGHEPDNYVDLLLKEFKRLELSSEHKVMSLDLEIMEELEKKAPELETGYVIPLQFGSFDKHGVDFYVIEDFSYNDWVMWSAEQQGKDVYVWTINDESLMSNYLQTPINGIITDELDLFKKKEAELRKDDSYFDKALRLLEFQP
ncbi:glycerophosphoryl diester phosphodiesterase membrane domain-containing protein [Streptococcus cameli]